MHILQIKIPTDVLIIFENKPTCTSVILGWYNGIGLKSGRVVILGHVSSVGVPKSLKIRFNWSSTSDPGNNGRPALANSDCNAHFNNSF